MLTLLAKIRKDFGEKIPRQQKAAGTPVAKSDLGAKPLKELRRQGQIPAVVYGPGVKNVSIQVEEKEFKKVFHKAGESSLVELSIEGEKEKKLVLIHEMQKDPVSDKVIHIDFFQASLKEEVEVEIPLVFEGAAPAEKDLGGTLNKNMLELSIKALPQNLLHEIVVNIDSLKTFEDHILVKDLVLPKEVTVLKKPEEIVASVLPPRKVEEELAAEIKENVEDIEKAEKPRKEEDIVEEPKESSFTKASTSAKTSAGQAGAIKEEKK